MIEQEMIEQEKENVIARLAAFEPITLPDMSRVALLDRVEVKYFFHINKPARLLAALQESYSVLVVEGRRLNRYQTLYFNTKSFLGEQ